MPTIVSSQKPSTIPSSLKNDHRYGLWGRHFEDTHDIPKSRKIPVLYFQKSRYRYLSPIPVYWYFAVYRRGLVVTGLGRRSPSGLLNVSLLPIIGIFTISMIVACLLSMCANLLHLLQMLLNLYEVVQSSQLDSFPQNSKTNSLYLQGRTGPHYFLFYLTFFW